MKSLHITLLLAIAAASALVSCTGKKTQQQASACQEPTHQQHFTSQATPTNLCDIDISMFSLNDKKRSTYSGMLKSVLIEKVDGTELLTLTVEGKILSNGKLYVHNDCKTIPEIQSDGLSFMQSVVGQKVWLQLEPSKTKSGKEILLVTDLVVAQSDRFADLGFDNEGSIYETLSQMADMVRNAKTEVLTDIIAYPITIQHKGTEYTISSKQEALKTLNVIFNNKVKSAILNQSIASLFVNQYGIMIGEGELWLTTESETNDELRIYKINPF